MIDMLWLILAKSVTIGMEIKSGLEVKTFRYKIGSYWGGFAERVGFEPTEHINSVHRISSAAHSASSDTSPKWSLQNLNLNRFHTERIETIYMASAFFDHIQWNYHYYHVKMAHAEFVNEHK